MGPLIEGRDYTREGHAYVFTREFLLRRGTCCRSGCRNCPYGYQRIPTATAVAGS